MRYRTSIRWFSRTALGRIAAALTLSLLPLALAQGDGQTEGQIDLTDAGFMAPESMLHDESADLYLVSNINGMPTEADGNGFISRVSPEGEVVELRWIDGEGEGVELDAPKGMAIVDGTLYVADITAVRMFDSETGEQTGSVAIDGAEFLNDVTPAPDGGVYVTDTALGPDFQPTGNAAVYHVMADGTTETHIASPELDRPNGIVTTEDGEVVVVTFGNPGQVIRIVDGEIAEANEFDEGSFDGVVELAGGDLLVSSWSASGILRVSPDGTTETVIEGFEGPADIGFDRDRGRVLIPLLQGNAVHIVPLPEVQQ